MPCIDPKNGMLTPEDVFVADFRRFSASCYPNLPDLDESKERHAFAESVAAFLGVSKADVIKAIRRRFYDVYMFIYSDAVIFDINQIVRRFKSILYEGKRYQFNLYMPNNAIDPRSQKRIVLDWYPNVDEDEALEDYLEMNRLTYTSVRNDSHHFRSYYRKSVNFSEAFLEKSLAER